MTSHLSAPNVPLIDDYVLLHTEFFNFLISISSGSDILALNLRMNYVLKRPLKCNEMFLRSMK